jgi:uncharacterized oxidoreductase
MRTTGNTILITGGTSGLGLAFAEQFYKDGNTVIICGRREDRLKAIAAKHPGIITRTCDISNEQQRTDLCSWTLQHYPALNILMNNAGIQIVTDLTKPVDLAAVRSEIETNLTAPIHLGALFTPHLKTKPDAAIMNISSGLAFVPLAFMPVYCATKAAFHSLTLSLRYQLRDTSVKVFEIAPPSTDTELGHQRRADKTQSHGGIPISEFLAEAMEAIKTDQFEALIGDAKGLRAKGEALFQPMNERVRS